MHWQNHSALCKARTILFYVQERNSTSEQCVYAIRIIQLTNHNVFQKHISLQLFT